MIGFADPYPHLLSVRLRQGSQTYGPIDDIDDIEVEELLQKAIEVEEVASTISAQTARHALESLAARFRTFAARRASKP